MKKYIYFIFVFVTACRGGSSHNESIPKCLGEEIKGIENSRMDAKIYRYKYNGRIVYYVQNYIGPDGFSALYDDDCKLICHPDGGITGRGDGKCPDFHQSKTDEFLIYQKK
jgi:hypothetical protein